MPEGFRYDRPDKKITSLIRGFQLSLDHSETVVFKKVVVGFLLKFRSFVVSVIDPYIKAGTGRGGE